MRVSTVLFDLDGTLVDSLLDLTDAVNAALEGFERPKLSSDKVERLIGKGLRNLVQRALESDSLDDLERGVKLFEAYNRDHIIDNSRLYPGMLGLLESCKYAGLKMVVISNKNEELCRLITAELGIDRMFELIVGGDTFGSMKPSPVPLLRVMEQLNSTPDATLMIGDSCNDIQAGTSASVRTIGCSWGYGGEGELFDADFVVSTTDELKELLTRLCS